MHGHDSAESFAETITPPLSVSIGLIVGLILFYAGVLPIPIGYDRGKVRWLMWCGTGMHAHAVYWHGASDGWTDSPGFVAIHPEEVSE